MTLTLRQKTSAAWFFVLVGIVELFDCYSPTEPIITVSRIKQIYRRAASIASARVLPV